MIWNKMVMVFLISMVVFAAQNTQSGDQPYIITALEGWKDTLADVGIILAFILIILGAIVYGVSQMQPAEVRGKWESTAIGLVVGGLLIAVIIGASGMLVDFAQNMFNPTSQVEASHNAGAGAANANTPQQNYIPSDQQQQQ
ncbi:hypothetical protein J7J90_01940 [Candidatus Micrarchaeota archaeon]|nr:hypothetical protein [Candidatus Micrarchaeota archaeon]